MATPIDRLPKNTKGPNPTKTTEQNYCGIKYGNEKGSISMGQIHEKGDVTSGIMLQTPDSEHNFTMEITGPRKGHSILTSPSNVAVKCGMANTVGAESFLLDVAKGNLNINAPKGKIRIVCDDFELVTLGKGTDSGNIIFNAAESFDVNATKIQLSSSAYTKICGAGIVDIAANSVLNVYGSLFNAIGDAIVGSKDSKFGGKAKAIAELETQTPDPASDAARYDSPNY